ncbi:uncharacterized protein LOC108914789 [Anoplophora glabripennis]|uniref:uncharacterized protein LOC108914789 n=1 Tax=Anoplophora glabripennis TaxID=217634 RepID=UPI000874D460|nr:uncharacterized protein LOC108914789 [Anoplophora glabripennis]
MSLRHLALLTLVICSAGCCDLEQFFSERQVSVEESASSSEIVFRGVTVAEASPDVPGVFTAYFELINTYKGADALSAWGANNYRINVTFLTRSSAECAEGSEILREYIIFCDLVNGEIRATSVAKWGEETDERVWAALGWGKWSEWSSCSVSCSSGIQQRTRRCRLASSCPGFNVEQRHCNLFGCGETVNPLALEERRFFHPTKDRWQAVPDRPTAWRLRPNSYIWVPSTQLFSDEKNRPFPREFALFVTMRLHNGTMGTIFSLRSRRRQDTYLSLEVAGSDLKLIHAAENGTDVVRIPAELDDGHWHQIAVSIRDDSVVDSYVDCEWSRTDILRSHTLDIPEDSDLIIGYLFTGDLEQLSIVSNPGYVNLQCAPDRVPIIDPEVEDTVEAIQEKSGKHIVMRVHKDIDNNKID